MNSKVDKKKYFSEDLKNGNIWSAISSIRRIEY